MGRKLRAHSGGPGSPGSDRGQCRPSARAHRERGSDRLGFRHRSAAAAAQRRAAPFPPAGERRASSAPGGAAARGAGTQASTGTETYSGCSASRGRCPGGAASGPEAQTGAHDDCSRRAVLKCFTYAGPTGDDRLRAKAP